MRFNETVEKEPVVNYMDKKAYKQTPKEELIFAVLTTFMENSYYESKDERLKRIKELVGTIAKKDPAFVAKLAIYARTTFNMRSVFPVLIGELAKVHSGDSIVRKGIAKGVTRVDDITELVAYLGVDNLSTRVKKGINQALNKFDSYQFAKYSGKSKEVSLVDVVNLTHPKATNPKTAEALRALIKDELKNTDTWESKKSAGESTAEVFNELLDDNKLGYMALLRNLRNIVQSGDVALVQKAAASIRDPEKVAKSKQLPFRFLSAYEALEGSTTTTGALKFEKDVDGVEVLKQAVEEALLLSIKNIPLLSGRTMILSDNSGSMGGDYGGKSVTSAYSQRTTANIANLFATLYWMRADNTMVGLFGDLLLTPKMNRAKGLFENYKALAKTAADCGPSTEKGIFEAFNQLIASKTLVDRIVIFSDCQVGDGCSWYDNHGNRGDNFNALLVKYLKVNPTVKVYSVNLKGYNNEMTPQNGQIMRLTGWSDKIFDIMERNEIAPGTMTKEVDAVSLD